jgi:hypothetical protein
MPRFFLFFVLVASNLIFFQEVHSQKKISFGTVTLDELQMTSYKPDSTAGAVILSDIGKFDGSQVKFSRHIRVKILKKSGLDWGNWVFNTPSKGDFKVTVFNLVDGQITKHKAEGASIYREEIVKNFEIYKVFAPNVKVGSVIDIFYSFLGIPFEWRFQERIPVAYNELTMGSTPYATYSKSLFGFEKIETVSPTKWRAQNMPAFKIEPFLSDYSNYVTKFEFQVETVGSGGLFYVNYSASWARIIDVLLESPNFGGVMEVSAFLNDFARECKKKNLSTHEKIDEAFSYIRANMKWDGNKSVFATNGLRNNFLNNHSGNSAEINLTLITLLNKLDIKTYPVVLSTRENGLLVQHSPTFNKLNYVVGYVQHEGIELLLDATSENIVPGILPAYCLNGDGLLVKANTEEWLELNNKKHADSKKQFTTISIDKEGNVKAKINHELNGYAYLRWVENQNANNNDNEIHKNKLQKEYPEIEILSFGVAKNDAKAITAKEIIDADLSSLLIETGESVIFNPFVMFEYSKNPFQAEERKYPVDLNYPKEVHTTIVVQIPKEFSVKKLPESIKLSNPDGSASFTYYASASASGLQFRTILKFNKHIFTELEYLELKQFISEVLKKVNTPVELSKS